MPKKIIDVHEAQTYVLHLPVAEVFAGQP